MTFRLASPVRAVFETTHRCNLICPYCYTASGPAVHPTMTDLEVRADLLIDAIKVLDNLEVLDVTFTGGEPTVRSDFGYMCEGLSELKFSSLCLITNGTFITEALLEKLEVFQQICVSIDGIGEVHDQSRGKRGAYARAVNGVTALIGLFPNLKILITVTKLNRHEVENVVQTFSQMGCRRFDVVPVRKLGRIKGDNSLCLNHSEMEELSSTVAGLRGKWTSENVDVNICSCYYDLTYNVRAVDTCKYSEYQQGSQITISPRGDVYLDRLWSMETIGNIQRESMTEIWERAGSLIDEILADTDRQDASGRLQTFYYDLQGTDRGSLRSINRSLSHWPSRKQQPVT